MNGGKKPLKKLKNLLTLKEKLCIFASALAMRAENLKGLREEEQEKLARVLQTPKKVKINFGETKELLTFAVPNRKKAEKGSRGKPESFKKKLKDRILSDQNREFRYKAEP